jgi:hypothetical protein
MRNTLLIFQERRLAMAQAKLARSVPNGALWDAFHQEAAL